MYCVYCRFCNLGLGAWCKPLTSLVLLIYLFHEKGEEDEEEDAQTPKGPQKNKNSTHKNKRFELEVELHGKR